jgi:hypothetical protein
MTNDAPSHENQIVLWGRPPGLRPTPSSACVSYLSFSVLVVFLAGFEVFF